MSTPFIRSLVEIVGPAHCLGGAERAPYAVDGRTPCAVVFPGSAEEVSRVVGAAAQAGVPVLPWGGGTQMSRGASPRDGALVVGLRRLDRLLEHEPGDLTATAEAGITLEALQAALGARGQWFPLDPPAPAEATLGGVLATNAAGPRRYGYGTARDLVVGIRVVGADGQLIKAGGRVMKNVAGYDLAKLYIGSLGTLGIIVEASLKLQPRPDAEGACWATFPTLELAARAAAALAATELGPAALTLLDPPAAAACERWAKLERRTEPAVLVAFEGLARTVVWQREEAARQLGAAGAETVARLDAAATARVLGAVREARRLVEDPVAVAIVGVLPVDVPGYLEAAAAAGRAAGVRLAAVAHVGNGAVTLVLAGTGAELPPPAATVAALHACRDAARARTGQLALEWAPLSVREVCPVWDDVAGPALALMRGLKTRLDPQGVLNPGRFVGGI